MPSDAEAVSRHGSGLPGRDQHDSRCLLFLQCGYAVGHLGIVLLGHLVTIPTALALAGVATNRRVLGGGEFYIITSRSCGMTVGGTIGSAPYLP